MDRHDIDIGLIQQPVTIAHLTKAAKQFDCHKDTVALCRRLTAASFLQMQRVSMSSVTDGWSRKCGGPFSGNYVVSSLEFDETQHRLTLKLDDMLESHQGVNQWHVCVATSSVVLGAVTEGEAKARRSCMPICTRIPVPVITCDAPNIYHALFHSEQAIEFESWLAEWEKNGGLSLRNITRDHATSNSKCLAHRIRVALTRTSTSDMVCIIHEHKHIETSLVFCMGVSIVASLYSMGNLMHMGRYYMRMLFAVNTLCESLELVKGNPPPEGVLFAAELASYLRMQVCCFVQGPSPLQGEEAPSTPPPLHPSNLYPSIPPPLHHFHCTCRVTLARARVRSHYFALTVKLK